jgi:hypothetical protein
MSLNFRGMEVYGSGGSRVMGSTLILSQQLTLMKQNILLLIS